MTNQPLKVYQSQVKQELINNILPFHIHHGIDNEHGGFYGLIANDGSIRKDAPKGLVHNTRLLWTYSHAYQLLGDPVYLETATRAYEYLSRYFLDPQYGGFHWMLDYLGNPMDTRKMTYGQAFAIYSLAEYALATEDTSALSQAIELFSLLEDHFCDQNHGGYFDNGDRNWEIFTDDSVDQVPAAKTMNTHLHLLEAYTNLLRAWNDDHLRGRLRQMIEIMLNHVIDRNAGHFKLHFDAQWNSLADVISFGHDIEGSWLLVEATDVLGDVDIPSVVKPIALKMAQATLEKGVDRDGGLFYEGNSRGVTDFNKEWWPQAEAMVGFLNAYQISRDPRYLKATLKTWEFIQNNIIDHQYGEWFRTIPQDGIPLRVEKAGLWKSPYHNSRACMEVMQRIDHLLGVAH
jgi:mannobiose 2-epimerase